MFVGLSITAVVSYTIYMSPSLQATFIPLYFIFLILQLGLVILLSWKIKSLSPAMATGVFIFYAALTGITLTAILMFYTISSVFIAFVTAAGMFIGMSLFGFFTKRDLSGVGRFMLMALIGLIIAMVLNLLLFFIAPAAASSLSFVISAIAVLIFAALTAYDTQRIKEMGKSIDRNDPFAQNLAIIGALRLYLDFINLFIHLLRIMGTRR
jgi:FtsH-binding integral membrane protein